MTKLGEDKMLVANTYVADQLREIANGDETFLTELWISAEHQGFAVWL